MLLVEAVIAGLLLGCFYAAVSIGLSIAFGLLGVPHIAHPAFLVLGAYGAYLLGQHGMDPLLAGLEDAPRPGGPKTVLTDEVVCEILAATVTPPPESLQAAGVTHWSSRRLADWLRRKKKIAVSHDSIARLWRRFCLQPHRTEGSSSPPTRSWKRRSLTSSGCTCSRVRRAALMIRVEVRDLRRRPCRSRAAELRAA